MNHLLRLILQKSVNLLASVLILSRRIFPLIRVIILNIPACACAHWQWTLHRRKPYLHLPVCPLRVCWQPAGDKHQQEGRGLQLGLLMSCHSPLWPLPRCLGSTAEKTKAAERKKQAGKPAEFWWALTHWEPGGKTEEGNYTLKWDG